MSKKKDRRLKRLQRHPIWPAVVEIIITETIIFTLTTAICILALFGIINTVFMQNLKECRTIVQTVNENWYKESRQQLQSRMTKYTETYSDITEIIIDDGIGAKKFFPEIEDFFNDETEEVLNTVGMVHFLDPKYDRVFETFFSDPDDELQASHPARFLFNQKYFIKAINIGAFLHNPDSLDWAQRENNFLGTISVFKTDIPNVRICFRNLFTINAIQYTLFILVLLFFSIVFILDGFYDIKKIITVIHERRRLNQLITTDTITGGNNKDCFMQRAGKRISKGHSQYAVVQLRLEKYRNFCTAYGLKQGENLLEDINQIISEILGKKELVAHIEKSDFALLLEYYNQDELDIHIKNIMNTIRERRNGQHLTFSAGVCPVNSKSDDIADLLTFAGVAVPHEASIKDEIDWFNDSMKENQVWERRIEDDMEEALYKHEFQVYLQPKYSTKGEKLSAAEALVRWDHPVLGFISPGKFIPLFEKNGFILMLDDYMLTEVARLQSNWLSQGKKLVPISVNVSRAHCAEDNLAEHICYIVDRFKVPHEYIELELTESAFFDDKATLLSTVRKLKDMGFKVSMDDFGAGYSSLNSLKELPLDIIKLDAEFFRSVDDITRSNLIVGETISLAKKLGMQIVAEGIETREQVDFLAQQNCDLIQGFYFSKPLPVSEFEDRAFN